MDAWVGVSLLEKPKPTHKHKLILQAGAQTTKLINFVLVISVFTIIYLFLYIACLESIT